ncbi:MAG: HAMP domain-containing sensor histidine kinase [Thermodesulfobacteriota bacterium]|nr:HAMP domain-containing sensor histidine kinase [Thermodesulfobacteriota bacterium]
MKIYHPKSFRFLLLSAFALVALPLLIGLVSAEYFMGQLASKSAATVYRTTTGVSNSRILLEQLRAQERKALMFDVLEDAALFSEVEDLHGKIQSSLLELIPIFPDGSQRARLFLLRDQENTLFFALSEHREDEELRKEVLGGYMELNKLANEVSIESSKLMLHETEKFSEAVHRAQKTLFWQASCLIFFSIVLVTLFALIIIRPIRQIDQSIMRLGKGDFTTPVRVSGPKDLEFIGEKLNWLRGRLAELDQEKIKFVAHISHDLKTPLSALREGADLLGEEVVGGLNEQQKEVVGIVVNNSVKLQKLIENILDFNMAQARKAPLRQRDFDITALISEVAEAQKPLLLKKEISLHSPSEPMQLFADRRQIGTVIENLLSNSIKHTPIQGEIHIQTNKTSRSIVIEMIDSGPGISEDEMDKVFSPFFQGRSPAYSPIKGSGLGLAIVQEYIANHKGTIEVLTGKKKGAHFVITLPQE